MEAERDLANIALLGFMAAGKSSVGRALAECLGWCLVDVDEAIVARAGMSIPEIFARWGEAGFRDRETAVLRELVKTDGQVLACGGGVVLRAENNSLLQRRCWRVLLWADPATLAERILSDPGERPVLGVTAAPRDPVQVRERLGQVLAEREPLYRAAADLVLQTDRLTPAALAACIAREWEIHGRRAS